MPAAPTAGLQSGSATSLSKALFNVLVTLALFVVTFIGFLIAPWLVLVLAAALYGIRMRFGSGKQGKPNPEADGAIQGFGLGGQQ